mmetsp:Transcript_59/g.120  ORF Transcript_59/g.120 Transcript_59/m.120 type:complete len:303 (-) Transcript_59:696-1604(-)
MCSLLPERAGIFGGHFAPEIRRAGRRVGVRQARWSQSRERVDDRVGPHGLRHLRNRLRSHRRSCRLRCRRRSRFRSRRRLNRSRRLERGLQGNVKLARGGLSLELRRHRRSRRAGGQRRLWQLGARWRRGRIGELRAWGRSGRHERPPRLLRAGVPTVGLLPSRLSRDRVVVVDLTFAVRLDPALRRRRLLLRPVPSLLRLAPALRQFPLRLSCHCVVVVRHRDGLAIGRRIVRWHGRELLDPVRGVIFGANLRLPRSRLHGHHGLYVVVGPSLGRNFVTHRTLGLASNGGFRSLHLLLLLR